MDIKKLHQVIESHKAPQLFENSKTQADFWDNEHISQMMLMAHLNPNMDAASRKPATIEATCKWILSSLKLEAPHKLLDLGCGPGLYSTKFYEHGLDVTGVDYSKRSLAYAKEQANLKNQDIRYLYQDYLEMDFESAFDAVVLIYCDFGVFSEVLREKLLKKIHASLKPGGYFVFDVWSTAFQELTAEYKNWFVHEKQGFWKPTPHLELVHKQFDKDSKVSLKQHIIVEEGTVVSVYNLWEQCYTVQSITTLLEANGFEVVTIAGDLTGVAYTEQSNALGIIAKKR